MAQQFKCLIVEQLAHQPGVGLATIRRYELMTGVSAGNAHSVGAIQSAFEWAGWN